MSVVEQLSNEKLVGVRKGVVGNVNAKVRCG